MTRHISCTRYEIQKYWKKLGGALLDRIDMRVPVLPVPASALLGVKTADSAAVTVFYRFLPFDMAKELILEQRGVQNIELLIRDLG